MTILLPKPSFLDKFLQALGKKRGVFLPSDDHDPFGQYAYLTGQKENFAKALLRSARSPLPDGFIDIFEAARDFSEPPGTGSHSR